MLLSETMSISTNNDVQQIGSTNGSDFLTNSSVSKNDQLNAQKCYNFTSFTCKSEKYALNFSVKLEDFNVSCSQKCFIMTIHNIGFDCSQFQDFVHCKKMNEISYRCQWIHVNLPGQEIDAQDLDIRKYPSLEELADELLCVIDYLKIPQVICMGEGAGASIASLFAIQNPNRCLGVVLIEPVGSSANIFESIKFKLNNLNLLKKNKPNNNRDKFLSNNNKFERLSNSFSIPSDKDSLELPLNETEDKMLLKVCDNQNSKNLELFAESFFNRSSLLEKLRNLKADALIAVGKNSTFYSETKKFYQALQQSHKQTPGKMVNTPFLEIDNVSSILQQCPDRLATSFQYFLQGIGLLSAVPMKNVRSASSISSSNYIRSISMEEADRPNSSPQSQSQSESNSQVVSSDHSLNNI